MGNLFANTPGEVFPVKMNGRIIGEGTIGPDGAIELSIEDEEARRKISGGDVGSLSVDYNSKTIETIMNNRKKKGL